MKNRRISPGRILSSWLLLLAAQGVLVGQTQRAGSGSIAGVVVDAKTLKGVPSAHVIAVRVGVPASTSYTRTGGAGAFQIARLIDGSYSLCVQAGEQYVNPCLWNASPATLAVAVGKAVTGIRIALSAATIVSVQVRDTQKVLSQTSKTGRQPELSVGIWGPRGLYQPARFAGNATIPTNPQGGVTTYTYRIPVPRETALNLHVASADVRLGDANGVALPGNASRQAFQHAAADSSPRNYTFTVLGRLP